MELKLKNVIEVYEISDGVRKLSKSEKLKLADKMFKEKYQKKEVTLDFLNQEHFVKINADTRLHFVAKSRKEEYGEYRKRIEMAADGKYLDIISNSKYDRTSLESKSGQSNKHVEGQKYHYFKKQIKVDDDIYEVLIDIRERLDGVMLVHQTTLLKQ